MAGFRVPRHIWRTQDNRLVLDGDPDAAFLAYPTGEEMAEEEARRRGILDVLEGKPAQAKPEKAAKPGLTINRRSDKES
jgi:hypothetical protein